MFDLTGEGILIGDNDYYSNFNGRAYSEEGESCSKKQRTYYESECLSKTTHW